MISGPQGPRTGVLAQAGIWMCMRRRGLGDEAGRWRMGVTRYAEPEGWMPSGHVGGA